MEGVGSLELIIGPMFSGKTTELIRRINRHSVIGKSSLIINSSRDSRCGEEIKTHDNQRVSAIKVSSLDSHTLRDTIGNVDVVAVDEAQFFTDLLSFVHWCLYTKKKHVIIAGLNGDFRQNKFGDIIDLIPQANQIDKLSSLCIRCGDGTPAHFSTRTRGGKHQTEIGDKDSYESVCRKHLESHYTQED
jgi:thymidine kinase